MSYNFKDQVVIVTGASSGIGESTARLFSQKGARVVLASRNKIKLDALASELNLAFPVPTDVTREQDLRNLVGQTLQKFGRIDILINNAGLLLYKPMIESSLDEIRKIMEVNYFGAVACAQAVIPTMKQQKSGVIVNISSIAGRVGFPNLGYYCASKFALTGFSETLRQELKPLGILVTTIGPGTVYTPMTARIVDESRKKGKRTIPVSPEYIAQRILRSIEKREIEVLVPMTSKLIYVLHFFFPVFSEWLAFKFRSLEPHPSLDR